MRSPLRGCGTSEQTRKYFTKSRTRCGVGCNRRCRSFVGTLTSGQVLYLMRNDFHSCCRRNPRNSLRMRTLEWHKKSCKQMMEEMVLGFWKAKDAAKLPKVARISCEVFRERPTERVSACQVLLECRFAMLDSLTDCSPICAFSVIEQLRSELVHGRHDAVPEKWRGQMPVER